MACLYTCPIVSLREIYVFVSMDFDLPLQDIIKEKLRRSNVMLRNLVSSLVDGVIAADKQGNSGIGIEISF